MNKVNKVIVEEAAEWALKVDEGQLTEADKKALSTWLKASPIHVEEMLFACSLLGGLSDIEQESTIDISMFLDNSDNDNVIDFPIQDEKLNAKQNDDLPLTESDNSEPNNAEPGNDELNTTEEQNGEQNNVVPFHKALVSKWNRKVSFVQNKSIGLAASILIAIAVPLMWLNSGSGDQSSGMHLITQTGEQQSIALQDNSVVHLNTNSEVKIHFKHDARVVELLQGEAFFEVSKNKNLPFRVIAGETVTEVLGTAFNVRFIQNEAVVSVEEGKVAFDIEGNQNLKEKLNKANDNTLSQLGSTYILQAGDEVELASKSSEPLLRKVKADIISTWRKGQLVFDSTRLDDIVAEFNRYNEKKLVIVSKPLEGLTLSGVFDAKDPEALVNFLVALGDVHVSRHDGEIQIYESYN